MIKSIKYIELKVFHRGDRVHEAFLALDELGADKFEIVVPSLSIKAEPPVAVVDEVVDSKARGKWRKPI